MPDMSDILGVGEKIDSKITNIGAARCDICDYMRADCVKVKTSLLFSTTICDRCGHKLFKKFDPKRGGAA